MADPHFLAWSLEDLADLPGSFAAAVRARLGAGAGTDGSAERPAKRRRVDTEPSTPATSAQPLSSPTHGPRPALEPLLARLLPTLPPSDFSRFVRPSTRIEDEYSTSSRRDRALTAAGVPYLRRLAHVIEQLCPQYRVDLPRWAETGDSPDTLIPIEYAPRDPAEYPRLASAGFQDGPLASEPELSALRYVYGDANLGAAHWVAAQRVPRFNRYLRAMAEVAALRAAVLGDQATGRPSAFDDAASRLDSGDEAATRLRELGSSAGVRRDYLSRQTDMGSAWGPSAGSSVARDARRADQPVEPASAHQTSRAPPLPRTRSPEAAGLVVDDFVEWTRPMALEYSASLQSMRSLTRADFVGLASMVRYAGAKGLPLPEMPSWIAPHAATNPAALRIPIHRSPRAPDRLPRLVASSGPTSPAPLSAAQRYSLDALRWLYQQSDLSGADLDAFRALSDGAATYVDALGKVFELRAIVIGSNRDRWELFDALADHLRANGASALLIAEVEQLATDPTARRRQFQRW